MLIRCGKQALALHLIHHRQLEGKHRRGGIVFFGPLHGAFDHRTVADVDAVKKAHCHSRAVGTAQRKRRKL